MRDYARGGFMPGPALRVQVVPPRELMEGDIPDWLINTKGKVVGRITWHKDGTVAFPLRDTPSKSADTR